MNSIQEYPLAFFPKPGTSLAKALYEQILSSNSNETIQTNSSISNSTKSEEDKEKQSLNESENTKYKTELCRNFTAYGVCSYSSRCQFAHGLQELRSRTRHPKYKTELCKNYISGYCKYGSRCQFLHNFDENKETPRHNHDSSMLSTVFSPTTVATIGTYLLTNILAQSIGLGTDNPFTQQTILASLGNTTNIQTKSNSSTVNSIVSSAESQCQRTMLPLKCGIEMQQISKYHLFPNTFQANSILQNYNNSNSL